MSSVQAPQQFECLPNYAKLKSRSYEILVLPWKWMVSAVMTIIHVAQWQIKVLLSQNLDFLYDIFDFLSHNYDLMGLFFFLMLLFPLIL